MAIKLAATFPGTLFTTATHLFLLITTVSYFWTTIMTRIVATYKHKEFSGDPVILVSDLKVHATVSDNGAPCVDAIFPTLADALQETEYDHIDEYYNKQLINKQKVSEMMNSLDETKDQHQPKTTSPLERIITAELRMTRTGRRNKDSKKKYRKHKT